MSRSAENPGLSYGIGIQQVAAIIAERMGRLEDFEKGAFKIATQRPEITESQAERLSAQGRPECFESDEQWGLWVAAAKQSRPSPLHTYCEDCSASYRDQMRAANRCQWPMTQFIGGVGFRVFVILDERAGIGERKKATGAFA